MSNMKVVELYDTNFRDVVTTLRGIADDIENDKYGPVGCVALVLLGNTLEVFGMGPDSEAPSVGMMLNAGAMKLTKAFLDHGT